MLVPAIDGIGNEVGQLQQPGVLGRRKVCAYSGADDESLVCGHVNRRPIELTSIMVSAAQGVNPFGLPQNNPRSFGWAVTASGTQERSTSSIIGMMGLSPPSPGR